MKKVTHHNLDYFISSYFDEVARCMANLDKRKIKKVIDILTAAYKSDKQIFIIGNGGSASASSHMACDLNKGTLQKVNNPNEKRLRVISLNDNMALMTALANDLSFDDVFVQQLQNLLNRGDVVIAISGSGNSRNAVKAVEFAKKRGAKTIGFLGFTDGGKLGKLVDCAVVVSSRHYGPIEDIHVALGHVISSWLARVKRGLDGYKRVGGGNSAVPYKI